MSSQPKRFNKWKRQQESDKEMMTIEIKIHICKKTYKILEEMRDSDEGLPISRYVQIAIDNELDQEKPFFYPLSYQEEDYVEDKYAHQASLIFDFIRRYSSKGISLQMLTLLRRVVGIDSREMIYRGYLELLNSKILEEYYSKMDRFVYPRWYRKAKISTRKTE